MVFVNSNDGFATCSDGVILRTNNAGGNWNYFYKDTTFHREDMFGSEAYIVATNDSVFCFGNYEGQNNKLSWAIGSNIVTKSAIAVNIKKPVFLNGKIYCNHIDIYEGDSLHRILNFVEDFTVIGNYISASNAHQVYFSDDYGATWVEKTFPSGLSSQPYQSFYNGGDTLYATTNYSPVLHYSFDRGETWNEVNNGCIYYYNNLFSLFCVTSSFEGGYSEVITSTNDQFTSVVLDTLGSNVSKLYFKYDMGFAFGADSRIYKTSNLLPTSIHNATLKKKLKIYPNPTSEKINIEYENDIEVQSIQLLDMSGRVVKRFSKNDKELNVSDIYSCTYLLNIQTKEGSVNKKIVIE